MTTPSWLSGYVGDISYTLGFYCETAPPFLDFACAVNGVSGIGESGSLRYCELGCGLGYGTALLAAANPDGAFVGVDFNPSHIGEALKLARTAGVDNVAFIESDFAQAAASSDPQLDSFDVVAIHGVYSWISPEVRESLHEFLRAKVAPGGVVYISYNTYPGWSAAAPMQHLIRASAERASGDSLKRAAAATAVIKALADKASAFTEQSPGIKQRIAHLEQQDPHYVAHEYLNEHWAPLYVNDALAALAEAKLTYVGSATIAENRLSLCVPPDLIGLVQNAPDVAMRELLKDFAVNKQFRRDIFIKGPTRLAAAEAERRYRERTFALIIRQDQLPETWRVPVGNATAKPGHVETIFDRLSQGPATGADLYSAFAKNGGSFEDMTALLEVLVHNGAIGPCRSDHATVDRQPAERLNTAMFDIAARDDTHRFLAAPVLGSAIQADYFDRLAAPQLIAHGDTGADDIAEILLDRFEATGKGLTRGGQPVARDTRTRSEIAGMVSSFRTVTLPRWRQLGIVA